MKKKALLNMPVIKTSKKGKVITAQIAEGVLLLNCFIDKKLKARYCMHPENYKYEAYVDGKWFAQKLYTIFSSNNEWARYDVGKKISLDSTTDKETIDKFFSKECRDQLDEIDSSESRYLREKSWSAYKRKTQRVDDLMALVPMLPDGFEEWCNRVIFGGMEFLLYDKEKETYFCTACQKEHTIKGLKHNQKWICEESSHEVIVKRRQQYIESKGNCMVAQNIDENMSIARHFTVKRCWGKSRERCGTKALEEIRIILHKGLKRGRVDIYYGQRYGADEFEQDWWITNPIQKHCHNSYCYPDTCKEALEGTVYQQMNLHLMAEKGWKVHYNRMMINYRECGFLEYMVKGNFERLTHEISECFSVWGGYYGVSLDLSGENAQEVFGVDMQRVNRLRQRNGGVNYLRWLRWEMENRNLPEETIQWMEEHKLLPEELAFIQDRMSPIQVMNFMKRQSKECNRTVKTLFETWKDYLSMAARVKMDTLSEMIYRPKNLIHAHDELVQLVERKEAALKAGEIAERFSLVNGICEEIKQKYEFEDESYAVLVPNGIEDILMEGKILQHCMDKTDRYFERISNRETYIFFLRKTEDRGKPYYTLEVEPNGTIRQKRTLGDKQNPDIEAAKIFLKTWQQEIQRRITQEDKLLGEESRKLRVSGYAKLREEKSKIWNGVLAGRLLVDVLEEDLMEIDESRRAG